MAKGYSNDLRRRYLSAYERGEGTLEELAERFMVSLGFGKKLRQQWLRTGQMERVEQRRGTPRKLLDEHRRQLRRWMVADHDLTQERLQRKLLEDRGLRISQAQVGRALKQLGLRRKKSRSTPPSETRRRTASGAKSLSSDCTRLRRRS